MSRVFSKGRSALLLSVSIASISVVQANAADAGADAEVVAVDEITVTARKREERLIDVPLSITAFSQSDLEAKQIHDLRDIASLAPNVSFQAVGGRNTPSLFIRGVTNTATVGRLATTAVFVDGIYVLGGLSSVTTADSARVEVIKGPQATYFGRNTFAGAINFITREPSDVFSGEISTEATARGSYDLTASIEGPLIADKLKGRLLVTSNKKAAMYTATDGGDIGEETTRSISATLHATPTEKLTVRLRADYQHNDDGPPQTAYLRGTLYGNNCAGTTISGGDQQGVQRQFAVTLPYFCGGIPTIGDLGQGVVTSNTSLTSPFWGSITGNPNIIKQAFVDNSLNAKYLDKAPSIDHFGLVRDVLRLSANFNYELPKDITAVVNLGLNKNDTIVLQDTDRTDQENIYAAIPGLYKDFSAEIRFQSGQEQRLRWMVGANYFKSSTDTNGSGDVTFQVRFSPATPQTTGPALFAPQNANGERARVLAAFGSAEFDIFENLTISGELRYQDDKSKTSPDQATSAYARFKDWLPRVILTYKPNEDTSIYASWAKGVLPGQFNTQYINATAAERAFIDTILPGSQDLFPSQTLKNYEAGIKQSLFGRRLQYSLAAYYMEWGNLPSSSAVSVPFSPTRFTALVTSGDAELKGVEFDATARPLPGWDISMGLSYQEGEYKSYTQGLLATALVLGLYDFKGKEIPRMPDWQGSLSSSYRADLTDNWEWYVGGEVKYTGRAWDSEANIVQSDDFFRVNARVGIERDNLKIELFAKNLLNDRHWDFAVRNVSFAEPGSQVRPFQGSATNFQFTQGLLVGAPDKRELGLRLKYSF